MYIQLYRTSFVLGSLTTETPCFCASVACLRGETTRPAPAPVGGAVRPCRSLPLLARWSLGAVRGPADSGSVGYECCGVDWRLGRCPSTRSPSLSVLCADRLTTGLSHSQAVCVSCSSHALTHEVIRSTPALAERLSCTPNGTVISQPPPSSDTSLDEMEEHFGAPRIAECGFLAFPPARDQPRRPSSTWDRQGGWPHLRQPKPATFPTHCRFVGSNAGIAPRLLSHVIFFSVCENRPTLVQANERRGRGERQGRSKMKPQKNNIGQKGKRKKRHGPP